MSISLEQAVALGAAYTAAWNSKDPQAVASFYATKSQIVINRGELHNVYPGQPLVDANGDGGFIRDDMTWGELPAPAEVAEKAEELVKGSSSAKETTLAVDKAVEITQKVGQATQWINHLAIWARIKCVHGEIAALCILNHRC